MMIANADQCSQQESENGEPTSSSQSAMVSKVDGDVKPKLEKTGRGEGNCNSGNLRCARGWQGNPWLAWHG